MEKRLTDKYGNTTGYVKDDGRVTDKYGDTTGYMKSDGRITDKYGDTTGYLKDDGRITDKYGDTTGYRKSEGRLTDRHGDTTGYVKEETSGCFLTSACVAHKGLADDCPELTALRKYRDEYLLGFGEGRADVQQYYAIAPAIVRGIEEASESEQNACYERIYQVIQSCISSIGSGDMEGAHAKYKGLVADLAATYV